jgi:hypothetical protein
MSESARRFNIRTPEGDVLCPACGFPGYFQGLSYDDEGGLPGTGICPCCFWEPGFDDVPSASADAEETILDSLRRYRRRWWASPVWRGDGKLMPVGWDGKAQLERLLAVAPFVA